MPCVFLDNAPAYILRDSLSLSLEPIGWARVAVPKLQESMSVPVAGISDVDARDTNSDLHFIQKALYPLSHLASLWFCLSASRISLLKDKVY